MATERGHATITRMSRSIASLLAVALLVAAACAPSVSPPPSPSPTAAPSPTATSEASPSAAGSGDLSAVYDAVEEQVVEIRGLEPETDVEPQIVTPDEMGEILQASVEEDTPPELLAAYQELYRGLGLLDDDEDLAEVYVDLLESQVAGLYVPEDESLYVVSKDGGVGPVERVFYSHEFEHALQDQHFDLEALQENLTDQTDRQLARLALAEGDAYVLMTHWLQQNLTPSEIAEVVQSSSDPEAQAALERIPEIVKSQLLFPATQGLTWLIGVQMAGGWEAVNAIWERPPDSTEQILHPEKYQTSERPVAVALPDDLASGMGEGWEVALEDTFGEHQISIWLGEAPEADAADVAAAAAGWGGDRAALLRGPDEAWAIAWLTTWDTMADAAAFAEAAEFARSSLSLTGVVATQAGSSDVTVLVAADDTTAVKLHTVLGHTGP